MTIKELLEMQQIWIDSDYHDIDNIAEIIDNYDAVKIARYIIENDAILHLGTDTTAGDCFYFEVESLNADIYDATNCDLTVNNDGDVCYSCDLYYCDNCNEYHDCNVTDCCIVVNEYGDNETWCENCTNDYAHYCDVCERYESDDFECTAGRRELITPYGKSYFDRASWLTCGENSENTVFFGVELEIGGNDDTDDTLNLAQAIVDLFGNSVDLKEDGSINDGFEIVFAPMSIAYLRKNIDDFKRLFELINNYGFYGTTDTNCGMHIHFSKSPLNASNIQTFILMWEAFESHLRVFSRRTNFYYCDRVIDSSTKLSKFFSADAVSRSNNHYVSLNLGNSETIECRIFQSTTTLSTFIANIELVNNLVHIARTYTPHELSALTWNGVITAQPTQELIAYNGRRLIDNANIPLSAYIDDLEKDFYYKEYTVSDGVTLKQEYNADLGKYELTCNLISDGVLTSNSTAMNDTYVQDVINTLQRIINDTRAFGDSDRGIDVFFRKANNSGYFRKYRLYALSV